MISSKSRFIRAMKKVRRAKIFDACSRSNLPYFAVYENINEHILISENQIFLVNEKKVIEFSEIKQATCLVDDLVLLDGVMLYLKDGCCIKIGISGHDGNQYDAHAFVRFLMRTLEDRSVGGHYPIG